MDTTRAFLVVDDDPDVLKAAAMALGRTGSVDVLASPEGLPEKAADYEAVLLDMNFVVGARTGAEGLDALGALQQTDPALSVVLMTTYGGVSLAVEGLKRGAVDFVLKPWRNETLTAAMIKAAALTAERRQSREALDLETLERRAIQQALALYAGNISQAAAALGLTRPALYRRMARHGL